MPFEPIRFIHASNLRLDSQLRGVGPCPDEFRGLIETATITAFERVIAACVTEQVDFLLLTGNSFDENERSLPARIALYDGFRRLDRQGIRVFVLPGRLDRPVAWDGFPDLPDNVTAFYDSSSEAVAVLRDGKVIATVARADSSETESSENEEADADCESQSNRGPVRIGLCLAGMEHASHGPQPEESAGPAENSQSFDYLAIGGTDVRETRRSPLSSTNKGGTVHSPGAPQAIDAGDAGPHGCTLVEVTDDGVIECRQIPTAVVRSENISIGIEPHATQAELIERMRSLLDQQTAHTSESLWLVHWVIAGCGPLYDRLCDAAARREFVQKMTAELAEGNRPRLLHSLRGLPNRAAVAAARAEQPWAGGYFDALDADIALTRESLMDHLQDIAASGGRHAAQLSRLAQNVDCRVVLGNARQYGIDQFRRAAQRIN